MINLILIRHGNTFESGEMSRYIGSDTDLKLTSKGRDQADKAADYLLQHKIIPQVVFHSELQRQSETAAIIASKLKIGNLILTKDLQEIGYGLWENLTNQEIEEKWPQELRMWNEEGVWPEQIFKVKESVVSLGLNSWLGKISKEYNSKTILAVTSNGILRILNKFILEDRYNPKEAKVSTGGICRVVYDEKGKSEILSWNLTPA